MSLYSNSRLHYVNSKPRLIGWRLLIQQSIWIWSSNTGPIQIQNLNLVITVPADGLATNGLLGYQQEHWSPFQHFLYKICFCLSVISKNTLWLDCVIQSYWQEFSQHFDTSCLKYDWWRLYIFQGITNLSLYIWLYILCIYNHLRHNWLFFTFAMLYEISCSIKPCHDETQLHSSTYMQFENILRGLLPEINNKFPSSF